MGEGECQTAMQEISFVVKRETDPRPSLWLAKLGLKRLWIDCEFGSCIMDSTRVSHRGQWLCGCCAPSCELGIFDNIPYTYTWYQTWHLGSKTWLLNIKTCYFCFNLFLVSRRIVAQYNFIRVKLKVLHSRTHMFAQLSAAFYM